MNAKGAHEVLIGIAALVVTVIVLVMVAGFSDNAANACLAFMGALIFLQLLTNANLFNAFLANHPYITSTEPEQEKK